MSVTESDDGVRITPMWHDGKWMMKVRDGDHLRIEYEVDDRHVEPLIDALQSIDRDDE